MSYYNYFINIASVLVPFEANVLPTWELVYLFLLKIGRIVFVEGRIIFKYVNARFAMLLDKAVLTRSK